MFEILQVWKPSALQLGNVTKSNIMSWKIHHGEPEVEEDREVHKYYHEV